MKHKSLQPVTIIVGDYEKATKVGTLVAIPTLSYIKVESYQGSNHMKLSITLASALMLNLMFVELATAQTTAVGELNAEIDSEIEQMYQQQSASNQSSTNNSSTNTSAAESSAGNGAVVTQTVVVPAQPAVQKQPEVLIEGSPLSNSRAEQIRRGRQEEELRTESRIVEKLEQSRLEDEKKRAAILFGDKFDSLENQNTAAPAATAPVVAPASQIQPIIINQEDALTRDAVREEVRAALSEDDHTIMPAMEQKYFVATAGIGQYPDIQSITGNYSLGAGFGTRFDYFLVEGSFLYSNYTVNANYVYNFNTFNGEFDMNQYQGVLSTKYQLLGGFVRPVLGGLVAYSYREYTANNITAFGFSGRDFGTSHAIDLGIIAGVDLEFNSKLSAGFDMKYMFNMSNKISGNTAANSTPVEDLQYFTTGLFARVNF